MIPYFQTEGCTLYHTGVLEADIPSSSIDLVVTSPPYNVGICTTQVKAEEFR